MTHFYINLCTFFIINLFISSILNLMGSTSITQTNPTALVTPAPNPEMHSRVIQRQTNLLLGKTLMIPQNKAMRQKQKVNPDNMDPHSIMTKEGKDMKSKNEKSQLSLKADKITTKMKNVGGLRQGSASYNVTKN